METVKTSSILKPVPNVKGVMREGSISGLKNSSILEHIPVNYDVAMFRPLF